MHWYPFESGRTIGQLGSENGTIVLDDEHTEGARITLEKDGDIAPFTITCGIYGWFVHTCFFGNQLEASTTVQLIKNDLAKIIFKIPIEVDPAVAAKKQLVYASITQFVEKY